MGLPAALEGVRRRPGMYLRSKAFDVVVAFIDGYDTAVCGGLLVGFREWLIVRVNDGNNLAWSELILLMRERRDQTGDASLVSGLFDLLDEFLTLRESSDGLRRIYNDYEEWLGQQDWYTSTSPQWIPRARKRTAPKRR